MCRYSPTDGYYEMEDHPECRDCEKKEGTMHEAKNYLESIVQMLYSKDMLDLHKFEDTLDELCHLLNVKLLPEDLQIQRRTKERYSGAAGQDWLQICADIVRPTLPAAK